MVVFARRPLFRSNARLRQAVNFAVDRPALMRGRNGRPTDQLLPAGIPGFRDARIYPLAGLNLRKARALASGHLRSGKAVLYAMDIPTDQARSQILVRNLKAIGIDVEVKSFTPPAYFGQMENPRAGFDIAALDWLPDYIDPFQYTNLLFDGRLNSGLALGRFDAPDATNSEPAMPTKEGVPNQVRGRSALPFARPDEGRPPCPRFCAGFRLCSPVAPSSRSLARAPPPRAWPERMCSAPPRR